MEEELVFFGISPDIIHDCCYEDYRERKREFMERTMEDKVENANEASKVPKLAFYYFAWKACYAYKKH